MNNYEKLFAEISDQNIKNARKQFLKKYLFDNLLAILALIISVIALFT